MIYFITAREIGRVKIGHAKNPHKRLVSLQIGSPVRLSLERVSAGGEFEEARLHERFSDFRIGGEWFSITPQIESHMATLDLPKRIRKPRTPRSPSPLSSGPLALRFIERMDGLARKTGLSPATLSARILGNGVLLSNMRDGKTITLAKYERACAMLDEMEAASEVA